MFTISIVRTINGRTADSDGNVNINSFSATTKHYLKANNGTGTFNLGNAVRPSYNIISNGINYDSSTGFFTLEVGRVYKIEYTASFNSVNSMTVALVYEDETRVDNYVAIFGERDNYSTNCYYNNIVIPEEGKILLSYPL